MDRKLKNAFGLFKVMFTEDIAYIYRGSFNTDITDSILDLTESSIKQDDLSNKSKKRAYAIMVEGLQNITRHQDKSDYVERERRSIFVIQRIEESYYITTGNIIEEENIEPLKKQIEKINEMTPEELKLYYKEVLNNGSISDKGGAGLGLIDIAKKSKSKLSYFFKPINDGEIYYFYLHTLSPIDLKRDGCSTNSALDEIIEVHKALNDEDLLMAYHGNFNKESYEQLVLSLKKNISEAVDAENRLFFVVYEMLENVVRYGINIAGDDKGNPGIFFISFEDGKHIITTGNYIHNSEKDYIDKYFNDLTSLSYEDLIKARGESKRLDLSEMKKNIVEDYLYSIKEVDDKYSFLTIRAVLN